MGATFSTFRVVIMLAGVCVGALSSVFYYININLGWLHLSMGVFIGILRLGQQFLTPGHGQSGSVRNLRFVAYHGVELRRGQRRDDGRERAHVGRQPRRALLELRQHEGRDLPG